MSQFTILARLRFISIIAILFFILHISINYLFAKSTLNSVHNITEKRLQILQYDSKNLDLLIALNAIFEDAARTIEVDYFSKAKIKKELIIENLKTSNKYGREENISDVIKGFNNYFKHANSNTIAQIKASADNPYFTDYKYILKIQTLTKNQLHVFEILKKTSSEKFNHEKKLLDIKNQNYFTLTLLLSFIGLFIVSTLTYFLYRHIQKRFQKVQDLVKNLNTSNPDFSREIVVKYHDEIGEVFFQFNKLYSKLDKDYKTMNRLKIKAEDTAKIKSQFSSSASSFSVFSIKPCSSSITLATGVHSEVSAFPIHSCIAGPPRSSYSPRLARSETVTNPILISFMILFYLLFYYFFLIVHIILHNRKTKNQSCFLPR